MSNNIKVEKFTCPYCKVNATKVRFEKYHGANCKLIKKSKITSNAPRSTLDINKYIELHEKMMSLIGQYHNQHIYFMNHPTQWTFRNMVTIIMDMGKLVKEMKKNNLDIRTEMKEEVASKKKLIAAKKEAKKLRKQNGTNNNSIN